MTKKTPQSAASPAKGPSRARARKAPAVPKKPPRPDVAGQVRVIVDLMIASQWSPSKADDLAAEWGMSKDAVQKRSQEASRRIRSSLPDLAERVARMEAGINGAIGMALTIGDLRAASSLYATLSKVLGVPSKREISGPGGKPIETRGGVIVLPEEELLPKAQAPEENAAEANT